MATQSQIDANRINAQKSTGPKTPEGKAKSRRNGLQHGLTAKTCMLADEDPDGLLDLLEEIREKFNPQDTDEDFLIERMAKAASNTTASCPSRQLSTTCAWTSIKRPRRSPRRKAKTANVAGPTCGTPTAATR
jgi:hypothetical protein